MRNISLNQLFIVFVLGFLLFSDLSKISKKLRALIANSKLYKNKRKKQGQEKRDSNP